MAVAIIALGLIVGFTVAQPALDRAIDDLRETRVDVHDELVDIKNTELSISASYNSSTRVLNVTVKNSGTVPYTTTDIIVMVNGFAVDPDFDPPGMIYPSLETRASIKDCYRPLQVKVVGPWSISGLLENETIGN